MNSIYSKQSTFILFVLISIIHQSLCALQVDVKYRVKDVPNVNDKPAVPRSLATGNYRSSYIGGVKTNMNRKILNHRTSARVIDAESNVPNNTETKVERKNDEFGNEIKYNVGPGVNISVEKEKELVSVYLDEDCLKDVFTGRGRKQDLITKILPLFILPFLIQSAVVPFLVSALKLLLIKSIVVGKIAIFLLLFSAFKNHVKYAYENSPSYYPDIPNRRTADAALLGYRVEGKPAAWVN